ncbi:MAG TPA: FAD-binding oxidoreductase [Syntrophomonadaceae bacterium]|nr:FAD-binding oxidoreductase [Syntrophomonadaceae bacterium]
MSDNFRTLREKLDDRITTDPFECSFYTRDLASVPSIMTKVLFNTSPDSVVMPMNTEDVVEIVKFAKENNYPIIPRAAATSAYMNTVPIKGGIVVDLNSMRGVLNIDDDYLQVEVWCATPWQELERHLNSHDLALCNYPSSAVSATVGGWFNTEGFGIGSAKYGNFHDLVEAAEIVLPNGEVITSTRNGEYPLSWFLGKEGTVGIVTKVKFKIRKKPTHEVNLSVAFASIEKAAQAMTQLTNTSLKPYNIHFTDKDFYFMQEQIGFSPSILDRHVITATYHEDTDVLNEVTEILKDIANKYDGVLLPQVVGDSEWDDRLYALRLKRGGPTMLAAEVILSLDELNSFYEEVKTLNQGTAVYGYSMGSDKMNILIQYYADDSKVLEYLFLLPKTQRIYNAALKFGGRPYGIGVWNSVYIKKAYSKEVLAERNAIKQKLDPSDLMNPGKYYSPPFLLNPIIFNLGSSSANLLSSIFGIGKGR